jgi:hypothetical protein
MLAKLIVPSFIVDHNPAAWNQGGGNPFVKNGRSPFADNDSQWRNQV